MISFAELVSGKKSPAGSAGGMHGSRGPAGERRQPQKSAAVLPASGGKVAGSAIKKARLDFSHLAAACDAGAAEVEATARIDTPEQVAAFVRASAAKARGQRPVAAVKPPAAVKHDMTTAQGVADFVAASAAKCRAPSR